MEERLTVIDVGEAYGKLQHAVWNAGLEGYLTQEEQIALTQDLKAIAWRWARAKEAGRRVLMFLQRMRSEGLNRQKEHYALLRALGVLERASSALKEPLAGSELGNVDKVLR